MTASSGSTSHFIHPETGEILATQAEWRAALTEVEERLSYTYRTIWKLRGYTEHFAPDAPDMPVHRRNRTETQERVARCPRCNQFYSLEDEQQSE